MANKFKEACLQWQANELKDVWMCTSFYFFVLIERMETKRIFVILNRIMIFIYFWHPNFGAGTSFIIIFGHLPVCRRQICCADWYCAIKQSTLIFLRKMNKKRLHKEHKWKLPAKIFQLFQNWKTDLVTMFKF